ncbi:unnamed protein product [Phytomonas sp. EM1]|nr:unnamed protein product [Phytomonas sp. EM1]|eukprot:CCW59795.1 unnamed protein product [Phytomonas sp. isolate EM1]
MACLNAWRGQTKGGEGRAAREACAAVVVASRETNGVLRPLLNRPPPWPMAAFLTDVVALLREFEAAEVAALERNGALDDVEAALVRGFHTEGGARHAANALFDRYLRLLMEEGLRLRTSRARALVRCVESRSESGLEALVEAFMLLCTSRFGFTEPFLEAVWLPPWALTRLVELAARLHSSRVPTSTAILSALLRVLMEKGVAACGDMPSLNEVASLLLLPICSDLGVKEQLVERISQRAIELSQREGSTNAKGNALTDCALEKAYLIAYLVRANAPVSEKLLSAFRQSA